VSWLKTGALLAIARVALLFWYVHHPLGLRDLGWAFYPEALLERYNVIGDSLLFTKGFWFYVGTLSSIVALGSFVYAIPIVLLARCLKGGRLVGWLARQLGRSARVVV
jgi:hypothetical protein